MEFCSKVVIKSNQIKLFIRYSSTDAGLQQYRGNVFTTNNITSSVSWQHSSSDKNGIYTKIQKHGFKTTENKFW